MDSEKSIGEDQKKVRPACVLCTQNIDDDEAGTILNYYSSC